MEKIYILSLVGPSGSYDFKAFKDKNHAIILKNKIDKWLMENPYEHTLKNYLEVTDGKLLIYDFDKTLEKIPSQVVNIPEDIQEYLLNYAFGPFPDSYIIKELEIV